MPTLRACVNLSSRVNPCRRLQRLEIEVTRRCPLKCIHCSTRAGKRRYVGELSFDEIKQTITDFSELGGKTITITGGEPLSRGVTFIIKLLKHARNCQLLTRLYTSGYIMNERVISNLKDIEMEMVCVSIEGTEKVHDVITQVDGSYSEAIDALRMLHRQEIPTSIHFTPMKINYDEFQHVVNVGETLGVQYVKVFSFSPQGRGYENKSWLELNPTEMSKFTNLITCATNQGRVTIKFGGVFDGLVNSCSVGKKISITCDGYALPCLGLREKLDVLGDPVNIRQESLEEVWRRIEQVASQTSCLCAAQARIS